jgi:hypothetical protein
LLTTARVSVSRLFAAFCGVLMMSLALGVAPGSARADARSDYLVQLLSGSSQFRVRAQAAISLGAIQADSNVVAALGRALKDEHPAVRAAAANSLGRLADPASLSALKAATSDSEEPVRTAATAAVARIEAARRSGAGVATVPVTPSGPARYYVAVGTPASRANGVTENDLRTAHQTLRARVQEIDGVVLAPANESNNAATQVLKNRGLKGFYLESSVTSIENKPDGGVRAVVSLVVATYPGRDMRAVMQGAATALGGGDIKSQAVEAAFKSALRQLPQAMVRE